PPRPGRRARRRWSPPAAGSASPSGPWSCWTGRSEMRGTYRVQVRPGFDLDATAGLAGYLAGLGVSHLYTAPLLAATPGSEHGYDVVDHRAVNPELGGEEARLRLVEALRAHGLGLVVDIV